jgi:protein-arginine deiminase
MRIAIRSAQPDRSAGEVVFSHFLGPDVGAVQKHGEIEGRRGGGDHGYSMNSFGNWEVIPPYEKDGVKYPLGRNLWGAIDDPSEAPDPVFQDFYRAQRVQPEVNVDTSWLLVGHVDEFTSWVTTNTPRGWGMLIASPAKARQMLIDMQGQGQGAIKMFETKTHFDWATRKSKPAAVAIDAVLGNANLMAASQTSDQHIAEGLAILQKEIGLADDEITDMPFLIERTYGASLAYQPGTVNLLFVNGKAVIPDPFGPVINGVDPFKADLVERLGAIGVEAHFADDWDTFHEGAGEVHCGTNASRTMNLAWWETGR